MRLLYSRHLEHFLAAYETGSLRRAAVRSGVTQPALSKSLKLLESALEASLFERVSDGIVPTPAAHILRRHALQIVNSARYVVMEIDSLRKGEGGLLRIGAGVTWAATRVPEIVATLHRRFSQLNITVQVGVADQLTPLLLDGELDVVIASLSPHPLPAGFSTIELPSRQMMVFAAAAHPLARRRRAASLAELADAQIVGFGADSAWQRQTAAMFAAHGLPAPPLRLKSSSLDTLLATVAQSDCLTFLADFLAPQARARGLRRVRTTQELWQISMGVSYHSQLAEFAPLAALLRAAQEH